MPVARPFQGYYAILDVKGTSVDVTRILRHADSLLDARPCCLQLRGKGLGPADLCALGHALRQPCAKRQIPLCVNDRLDVALVVGADAVHIGQHDLPLADVVRLRDRFGLARLKVGISAQTLEQAEAAAAAGADYIGFGPVFSTESKADADPAVGLAALRQVASRVRVPVVAIGGISLDNVASVALAGASGAAAIAAVDNAPDPTQAGRRIGQAFAAAAP